MAEFQEVMWQAARMCKEHYACEKCPVCSIADMVPGGCLFGSEIDAGYIEEKIMGWAKEHPEHAIYPRWKDFLRQIGVLGPSEACVDVSSVYRNIQRTMDCMNERIPAEIAKTLGIKPVGGMTDENA